MSSIKASSPASFSQGGNSSYRDSTFGISLFGRRLDGSPTLTSSKNINTEILGTASFGRTVDAPYTAVTAISGTSITVASITNFKDGDLCIIINLQGSTSPGTTRVGNYERVKINGAPSGSVIVISAALTKLYGETDNSSLTGQKIVIQRIPEYNAVAVNSSGVLTSSAWDGTKGGLIAFMANTLSFAGGVVDAVGIGYRGGSVNKGCGEGEAGGRNTIQTTANGTGGGGGDNPSAGSSGSVGSDETTTAGGGGGGAGYSVAGPGGGGGYVNAGDDGSGTGAQGGAGGDGGAGSIEGTGGSGGTPGAGGTAGIGGTSKGDSALAQIFLGGGGGAKGTDTTAGGLPGGSGGSAIYNGGAGGDGGPPATFTAFGGAGGGIILIWAKTITNLNAQCDGVQGDGGDSTSSGATGTAGQTNGETLTAGGGGGGGGVGGGSGAGSGSGGSIYIVARDLAVSVFSSSGPGGGPAGTAGVGATGTGLNANAGVDGDTGADGGAGSDGRCKVLYFKTGTTYASASADGADQYTPATPDAYKESL